MSYTNELIDLYKQSHGIESDYAAAKRLGLRPQRISNYRTDISHADDKTAVMLADALGLDRLETIARINMDRATEKEDKAFWKRLASAAALVLCVVPMLGNGSNLPSSGTTAQQMYLMSIAHNSQGRLDATRFVFRFTDPSAGTTV